MLVPDRIFWGIGSYFGGIVVKTPLTPITFRLNALNAFKPTKKAIITSSDPVHRLLVQKTQKKLKPKEPSTMQMTTELFYTVNIELQKHPFVAIIEIFQCVLHHDFFTESKDPNGPETYVNIENVIFKVTHIAAIQFCSLC